MNKVISIMLERKAELEDVLIKAGKCLKNKPNGSIAVTKSNGSPQFYYTNNDKGIKHQYIKSKDRELAHKVIKVEYAQSVYNACENELKDINRYLKNHSEYELEDKYEKLCDIRKEIVVPLITSDKAYIEEWLSQTYEANDYYDNEIYYETKNGEHVRSKSEALLADMYYSLRVPYLYEKPIYLRDATKRFPDFTILGVKNRREIYHEHLGLLDDEEYRLKNLKKINDYRHNGIYSGKNLIITYESEGCPLNIRDIEKMIADMFEL